MKLYRSRRDSKLFGLCGGLAEMMNVDPTLLRLVVVVAAFFSGGVVIPIYIIASLVIPKEPIINDPFMNGFTGPGGPRGFGRPTGDHSSVGGPYTNHHAGAGMNPTHNRSSMNQTNSLGSMGSPSQLDEMMKDIEKKAMKKEIEELRAKLAKLENNSSSKGDE